MNILMLVGHAASGAEALEMQLRKCGMKEPLPSQRDARTPEEITRAICCAHEACDPCSASNESEIHQIHPGRVWDSMALDLLLGNLNQNLWGWSDPWSIHLLDYWKRLEPRITFILVYDEPTSSLTRTANPTRNVEHALANWFAYNSSLLGFFLQNSDRCLLVHSQQVHLSLNDHLSQIKDRLNRTPALLSEIPRDFNPFVASTLESQADCRMPEAGSTCGSSIIQDQEARNLGQSIHAPLSRKFLSRQIVDMFPECDRLYAELQSLANLPSESTECVHGQPADAWNHIISLEEYIKKLLGEIHIRQRVQEEENQKALLEKSRITGLLDGMLDGMPAGRSLATDDLLTKSAMLASQLKLSNTLLSYTRNALEHITTEKSELEQTRTNLLQERSNLIQQCEESARREKERGQQLEEAQIKATQEHNDVMRQYDESVRREHELTRQLEEARIRLTRELENQKHHCEQSVLREEELRQQVGMTLIHSRERVKRQLSYRLGNNLVKRAYNLRGWLGMPLSTIRIIRDFYEEKNAGMNGGT